MANMGLEVVSFTLRDIRDDHGYLDALGVTRTSEVKRDAAIGLAEAQRDSGIREAEADQTRQAARFIADTRIAESERDYNLKKAAYDLDVNSKRAAAELAYELQATKTRQEIRQEEMQIEVQQQEVIRREQELEATIRRPAAAERYRMETIAAGARAKVVAEAEADAESIRLRCQAQADAIRAQGLAEAEAMERKAADWKEYGQAAMIEQLLKTLPEVVAAVAQPLSKTEKIVMISGDGGMGASRLTQDITNVISQLPETVSALTGIDLLATIKNLPSVGEVLSESGKPNGEGSAT
jgi:flotillin